MPIIFNDSNDDIRYEYVDALPSKTMNLQIKNEPAYKMNTMAFRIYGFYKNSIYDSYKEKADLAKDIKEHKNVYQESSGSKLSTTFKYQDPLHHYSVEGSLDAMNVWQESKEQMKTYIACQNTDGHKTTKGFAHFNEQVVNGKPVIYIAQAGVSTRGKSIGRHLMECILSHYPAGTEFYILTRVFNTEAKNLYEKRLKFSPIVESEIQQLGYDTRYCGFKHTTTAKEVAAIKAKQSLASNQSNIIKHGLFTAIIATSALSNSLPNNNTPAPKTK